MQPSTYNSPNYRPLVIDLGVVPHIATLFPIFRDMPYPILLDGSMQGSAGNRFSYITADPFLVVRSNGKSVFLQYPDHSEEKRANPWDVLQTLVQRYNISPVRGLPPFQGGFAGYWGYDLGRHLEYIPSCADDDLQLPEMYLGLYDWVLAYDSETSHLHLFSTGIPDYSSIKAEERANKIISLLDHNTSTVDAENAHFEVLLQSNFTRESYVATVRKAQEHLQAGDSYQVNLSQRFHGPFSGDPWALYARLRNINPSPFGAYLGFPDVTVLSASPEEFINLEGTKVRVRPIKGTRPIGSTPDETDRYYRELIESDKERAENLMIVDLIRNDLGKVCKIGSVSVPSIFTVEKHPTVLHLVSTVEGELPDTLNAVDILKSCFPGGSVTGAPKLRSMQIIEALEPVRRGVYCGAIGYISFSGDMGTSIAIRTMVLVQNTVYLHLGGAIVVDSDPTSEYLETLQKGAGIRDALSYAC